MSGDGGGLAAGVFHLISAHEVVPRRNLYPTYYALCGVRLATADMSEYLACPHECECEELGRMACCPDCVNEALRLNRLARVEADGASIGDDPEPSPKLGEAPDRRTAKVAALGTGYSGSALDETVGARD